MSSALLECALLEMEVSPASMLSPHSARMRIAADVGRADATIGLIEKLLNRPISH
jgi:hypothetical protein